MAVMLLRQAIHSDQRDAGAAYKPLDFEDSDADALEHGRQQVIAMLADRPEMSAFAVPQEALCQWTVHQFAKRINGARIYWSHLKTYSDSQSDHIPPSAEYPGMIRVNPVAAGTEPHAAFEQLWVCAIFELHNIEAARDFARVNDDARNGKLKEDEYVKAMFALEWRAAQRARKFYVDVFLPHAKKYALPTDPYQWYCSVWGGAEQVLANSYSDRRSYPWSYYSPYFRSIDPNASVLDKVFGAVFR